MKERALLDCIKRIKNRRYRLPPPDPIPQRAAPRPAPWYWQEPIRWEAWWDESWNRWLVLAFPSHQPDRSVFYIWLSREHERDERYARRVAEALTRVYGRRDPLRAPLST